MKICGLKGLLFILEKLKQRLSLRWWQCRDIYVVEINFETFELHLIRSINNYIGFLYNNCISI